MCRLYGAPAEVTEGLTAIAKQTRAKGWWMNYSDVIPEGFDLCIGLEEAPSTNSCSISGGSRRTRATNDRAAQAGVEGRDVDGPCLAFAGVDAQLGLDDDSQHQAGVVGECDHGVGAVLSGGDLGEVAGRHQGFGVIGDRDAQDVSEYVGDERGLIPEHRDEYLV